MPSSIAIIMLSIIAGDSTFDATCSTNIKKVHTILTDYLGVESATAKKSLECFAKPEDIGKTNAYFIALAVHFDLTMGRYRSGTPDEKRLWESMQIPTKLSLVRYAELNRETISKMMKLTKGRSISTEMQAQAILRMWRFVTKSREVHAIHMEGQEPCSEDVTDWDDDTIFKSGMDDSPGRAQFTEEESESLHDVAYSEDEDEDEEYGDDLADFGKANKQVKTRTSENKARLDESEQDLEYLEENMQYEGDEDELEDLVLSEEYHFSDIH